MRDGHEETMGRKLCREGDCTQDHACRAMVANHIQRYEGVV